MTAVPETMPRRAAGRRGETPCRRDIERESGMRRPGTAVAPWRTQTSRAGTRSVKQGQTLMVQHVQPATTFAGRDSSLPAPVASTAGWTATDIRAVDTIRVLAADAVQRAGNGHPVTA